MNKKEDEEERVEKKITECSLETDVIRSSKTIYARVRATGVVSLGHHWGSTPYDNFDHIPLSNVECNSSRILMNLFQSRCAPWMSIRWHLNLLVSCSLLCRLSFFQLILFFIFFSFFFWFRISFFFILSFLL